MNPGVEAITTASLSLALDAATVRQQVIATNIANAGTVGFVPRRASFEAHLADNLRAAQGAARALAPELQVRIEPDLNPAGQPRDVHVDTEVAAMAENSLHYQALVRGLSRHLGILASAVTEGKR
ncbi:flagellar basal body protein [Rhizobacter sp. Root1221]|uniref:flagellar basal body rod protein FlgB n=1 Tax=Rhizobacter sp. Root1221 TaxID=1736433 RepID=UPI0006F78566|nr:flagellar basal body protein [Rhizobacter sp. Root1221]KQV92876.1 flagellar basal body protein [Rhizobacter sp. Root1221]